MTDRIAELQSHLAEAAKTGWHPTPGKPNGLSRIVRHDTPENLPERWWGMPTYDSHEFLTFLFTDRNRVPKVIYGVTRTPWTGRQDSSISYRKALTLLAQPVADSDVHN